MDFSTCAQGTATANPPDCRAIWPVTPRLPVAPPSREPDFLPGDIRPLTVGGPLCPKWTCGLVGRLL